ncbi:conserved hypothetical protein [Aspergillus terreus NIH2624]|uniref:C2H2-type domain-containing protein n=1 Tax=Aspergillus terreus (strain NIH 2624 / FGSC A1156) TaxID=341663 RepID=Q0CK02_ASPTN|nr:uncharacterized protein ATEG_05982 [Aspergillus terreus NIH2624]EAU33743.1 conserved hypothetical protein [Aspergillus terreus NIH2624]
MAGHKGRHSQFSHHRWPWITTPSLNLRLSHRRPDILLDTAHSHQGLTAFIHRARPQRHIIPRSPAAPSYMMNQPEYYLAQGSSVSSNPSSLTVSPPPQPLMTPSTVYSSPDSAPASSDADQQQVRVISFRPKPQCWDHGCNGREFSTFSNLLRHQREKSGVVAKAECPSCGAVFTRTTARNIHVAQGKCKGGGREKSSD